MTAKVFGYVRVSTGKQKTDRQLDALLAAGVDPRDIYKDVITGMKFSRENLDQLRKDVREGDIVVVASLDRLGRSLSQIVQCADELRKRGIVLKSLKESIDYSTSIGRMLAGIFGSLAEYERELMLERVSDARESARIRGTNTGRPSRLTADQKRQVQRLHAAGEPIAQLVETYGVSRRTIYRAIEKAAAV